MQGVISPASTESPSPGDRSRPLAAAILAGGRSSRMGRDKALLQLEEGGPTLLELTIAVLAQIAEGVFVIAPLDREYQRFGVEVVPDAFPEGGALGGIATGLITAGDYDLIVTACDHPFLSAPLLRTMATIDGDFDALAPRTRGRSRQGGNEIVQTLHAIYRPSCLPILRDELARGYTSSRSFFDRVKLRTLDEPELRRFDPELRSLFSVNTPDAFDEARRIHRVMRGPAGQLDYTQSSG